MGEREEYYDRRAAEYDEGITAGLKEVELANLAADTLAKVTAAAERGIQRIRHCHWLAYSFLRHCALSLW
jgi:hypothetical protein